jgi:superfamily II DNA or RNA helicase
MKKEALFIVDNSNDETGPEWNGLEYLQQWCDISKKFDIATGYFDISALNALDGKWQQLEEIRILMGDEMTKRTSVALAKTIDKIKNFLDDSIEKEKDANAFLKGVAAIIEGIRSGKIKCKIYNKKKFHAKCYITYSKASVAPPVALVGSSNFTYSGLTQNLELNVRISSEAEVSILQDWYEKHWEDAVDISEEIITVIEKHIREYTPFEVYIKSLHEFYKGHEVTTSEWEQNHSVLFKEISQYQKEAYYSLIKIANQWNGAFLCDGVGLGKTFVGLMLLERLVVHERKRVVLLVPKSGRDAVWEENIRIFLPDLLNNPYISLKIYNHTDLLRVATADRNWPEEFEHIKKAADVFIIDEGHNFRTRSSGRYKKLFELMKGGKKLFLLTATPINNSLLDLKNQIDLFAQRDDKFFSKAPIGLNSLTGYFNKKEKELHQTIGITPEDISNEVTRDILGSEELFKNIIVQRSRSYVKQSIALENSDKNIEFPTRESPQVVPYSLKKIYGPLLKKVEKAFDSEKPLLRLPVYSLYDKDKKGNYLYYIGDVNDLDELMIGRSLQVVALIRVLLLKRLESSVVAFRDTCENLLLKLYSFIEQHDEGTAQRWLDQNNDLFNLILNNKDFETEEDDAILPEELRFEWEKLDEKKFNVSKIVMDTLLDLKELVDFLNDLENFDFKKDDKIQALIKLLQTDEDLKQEKVIIFTEFMSTAKYLEKTLKDNNFQDLLEIDSSFNGDRGQVIKRFSPFYNKTSVNELKEKGLLEIRILIATDVLSEGINLQDARLLINYDLHWNPVRLMQRIGRVDRRMDSKLEDKIKLQYPHLASKRGIAKYWNFLPPDELNEILSLYQKVTNKTLRISKVFGIENKKLLTGYDDYEALKDFNHEYEGETSKGEEIKLLYQKILADEPSIEEKLNAFPLRVFSGKESVKPDTKGVFLCYRLPINLKKSDETTKWSLNEGITSWYFYEIGKKVILEDFIEINAIISCENEENRIVKFEHESLVEIQKTIKNHIINTYYKASQVPVHDEEGNSLNPVLLSWMEVN